MSLRPGDDIGINFTNRYFLPHRRRRISAWTTGRTDLSSHNRFLLFHKYSNFGDDNGMNFTTRWFSPYYRRRISAWTTGCIDLPPCNWRRFLDQTTAYIEQIMLHKTDTLNPNSTPSLPNPTACPDTYHNWGTQNLNEVSRENEELDRISLGTEKSHGNRPCSTRTHLGYYYKLRTAFKSRLVA